MSIFLAREYVIPNELKQFLQKFMFFFLYTSVIWPTIHNKKMFSLYIQIEKNKYV